jgi:ribonuclease HI
VLCDGGSRGNPGPAAIAAVLFAPDGSLLDRRSSPIGRATAAEAEYRAILLGLELAATHGADPLELCSDSLLAIEAVQRAGAADVGLDAVAGAADAGLNARAGAADAGLEGLVRQIRAASRRFSAVSWRWHPARENEPADALVRELLWH